MTAKEILDSLEKAVATLKKQDELDKFKETVLLYRKENPHSQLTLLKSEKFNMLALLDDTKRECVSVFRG